jgi:hypothetical protein
MNKFTFIFLAWLGMLDFGVQAQPINARVTAELAPAATTTGIAKNSVTNLHSEGSTLWVGPMLNFTKDNGQIWNIAEVDSIRKGRGTVFSLDVEGNVIWVGLGFSERQKTTDSIEPVGQGFAFSEDGGQTWKFRLPPLDAQGDSLITYGVSQLKGLPVVTPVQSPPYDVDYDPQTGWVWTAGWASGIRVSKDKGITWQRVILPPDALSSLDPNTLYDFYYTPSTRGKTRPGNENHKGFSVLVDETGTVWAGTSGGLNRSTNGGTAWQKFTYNGSTDGLLGNWITAIEEQPVAGRNPIWATNWRALNTKEEYGAVVTRDGGKTFERYLLGEKIYDFAFNGNTIYAAGDNGLFISDTNGQTWRSIRDFRDASQPDRYIRPDAKAYSVALTNGVLWVGTSDGLFQSADGGKTWKLYRTEIPLHPQTPTTTIPDVATYAYPNPFSPSADSVVRIRYELKADQDVTIRIFDFGMNVVRTLVKNRRAAGVREDVWDGRDDRGLRIANAPYFYMVSSSEGTFKGKILVLE